MDATCARGAIPGRRHRCPRNGSHLCPLAVLGSLCSGYTPITMGGVMAVRPEQRTMILDLEADAYLRQRIPTSRGIGAYISRLILEDRLRKELAVAAQTRPARQEWPDDVSVD